MIRRARTHERCIPICLRSDYKKHYEITDSDGSELKYIKTLDPRWEFHVYINSFRVEKEKQGYGRGTRLMLRLVQKLREEGLIHHIYGIQRDLLGRPHHIRLHIPDSETKAYVPTETGIDHPAFGIVQESEQTSGFAPLYLETLLL